jgi:uncharacterized protein YjdB
LGFIPVVEEKLCQTHFVWTSKTPEIASVERTTGTITALSEGQADVEVLAQEHDFPQIVDVTVVAAR